MVKMYYLGDIKEELWVVDENVVNVIIIVNYDQWLLDLWCISYRDEIQQRLDIFGYKYDQSVLGPINTCCDQ